MKASIILSIAAVTLSVDAGFIGTAFRGIVGAVTGQHKRNDFGLTSRDLYAHDLFARNPSYARSEEGQLVARNLAYAHLYSRSAAAPKVNGNNRVLNPTSSASDSSTNVLVIEITIHAIVDMIKKKLSLPEELENAIRANPIAGFSPPAGRGPCPVELVDHPASHAIKVLNSGKIPPQVMAALNDPRNGWKTGAKGGGGGGVTGGGDSTAGAKNAVGKRWAEPEAFYENDIFAREAYPDLDEELTVYAREASPESFYEHDLHGRDAGPEFDYEDFYLSPRNAYAATYEELYD
ncbi:hypothetical protein MMC11_000582 [Xylographa trunciseda]|nr:hypothetical protein [Xylographa trunciseda]